MILIFSFRKKKQAEVIENKALSNLLTPLGGIEFFRNGLRLGESIGRIFAIVKYPVSVVQAWLSKPSNTQGTITTFIFEPNKSGELVESIARNISQNRGISISTSDPLTRQRAEKSAEDGERIMKQIDQSGEAIGYMSTMVMPISKDDELFEKAVLRTETAFSTQRLKISTLANLQKEGFQNMSPYHTPVEYVQDSIKRMVPLSTFIGGIPFSSASFSDDRGYYFAKDANDGLIILDTWKRGGDRINSNWTIMGKSGSGKSTAVKFMALNEFELGTKIICIDPENEYEDLAIRLGGDHIDCAGGEGGMINPLEIRSSVEDKEENEKSGIGHMALHMKTLEVFFELYLPTMTELQNAKLKIAIEKLYNEFDIHWETDISQFTSEEFPIISDLFNWIEKEYKQSKDEDYSILASLLREMAIGADKFIWNGHSTINPKSNFIVLNTNKILKSSDKIKSTQYYNILTWCWEQLSRDRAEKVLLICDEAYMLIDPNVPESLIFLRNAVKRARKYESAIVVISQSVTDFLHPSIKQYGQAILDNSTFKVLMGTDGKDLQEISNLFGLGETEEDILLSMIKGVGLFISGSMRKQIKFIYPDYVWDYFGTAGGR